MRILATLAAIVAASPAFAATGPFFSLHNTNFIVLLAFILFILVLFYFGVPKMLGGMLDKRAEQIKAELDEAKSLREEAQALHAVAERAIQIGASVHMPKLGTGAAGGSWPLIEELVVEEFIRRDVPVLVYEPAPRPRRNPSQADLFS